MPANEQLSVVVPTLLCSAVSFVATTLIGILYICFPPQKHFRQALVCNLLVADWINALNNTISGAFALHSQLEGRPDLNPGPACKANAWIGQFSVQAIDFSVLAIAVSVLLVIRSDKLLVEPSPWTIALTCLLTWVPSMITSNVALGLDLYGPVSGNWCWIQAPHLGARYALTHGWRVAIFLAIIATYSYVYWRLRVIFYHPSLTSERRGYRSSTSHPRPPVDDSGEADMENIILTTTHERNANSMDAGSTLVGTVTHMPPEVCKQPTTSTMTVEHGRVTGPHRSRRKILILSGYPVLYVVLWIPGMANRIAEAVGTTPAWLTALQATSQLVPLANVLTYAFNEGLVSRLTAAWSRRRSGGEGNSSSTMLYS